eukprot:TRINITY_DN2407_c0_g1_i5.p1 TRINITY_DN2407_c0_g1~~TRINITY_DN2407_c0_g1_i5.p1  ORF type:complete len:381 (+),score=28.63 TRINITY_DN2407_c0_g1_i5:60-1202(+)
MSAIQARTQGIFLRNARATLSLKKQNLAQALGVNITESIREFSTEKLEKNASRTQIQERVQNAQEESKESIEETTAGKVVALRLINEMVKTDKISEDPLMKMTEEVIVMAKKSIERTNSMIFASHRRGASGAVSEASVPGSFSNTMRSPSTKRTCAHYPRLLSKSPNRHSKAGTPKTNSPFHLRPSLSSGSLLSFAITEKHSQSSKYMQAVETSPPKRHIRNKDGSHYYGQIVDGRKEGFGKLVYKKDCYYEGEWKNNKRHGKGKLYRRGMLVYDGEWQDDVFNGEGTLHYAYIENDEQKVNVDLNFHDFDIISNREAMYQGGFTDGYRSGVGHVVYNNGAFFSGIFAFGKAEGRGTFRTSNGDEICGEWTKGRLGNRFA